MRNPAHVKPGDYTASQINLMAELRLNKHEINQVTQVILEHMTFERTNEMVISFTDDSVPENCKTVYDKMIYLCYRAYVRGYTNAIENYSEAIAETIMASTGKYPRRRHGHHKYDRIHKKPNLKTPRFWKR